MVVLLMSFGADPSILDGEGQSSTANSNVDILRESKRAPELLLSIFCQFLRNGLEF